MDTECKIKETKDEVFQVYWDLPSGIEVEDQSLLDPPHERSIKEIGISSIVGAVNIFIEGSTISANWDQDVLEMFNPDQRQVIMAHLGYILYGYMFKNISSLKEENIKKEFERHITILSEIEEEPGEFTQ